MGVYAFLVNAVRTALKAAEGNLQGTELANAEIILVCIVLSVVFMILATRKLTQINQANVDAVNEQKGQSEELLKTVLQVASSMTGDISGVSKETEYLETAMGDTRLAMEALEKGANETLAAIDAQQRSTDNIDRQIHNVDQSVHSIMTEISQAQTKLEEERPVMHDLLGQVQVSETVSDLVTREMQELKEYAGKMQTIMGLIGSIAKQTGILALNASIEAARAGQAGRGFAVVATEISRLSSQTNEATDDINRLIENITVCIEEVTNATERLLESNRLQNRLVDTTADNLKEIHESTLDVIRQADILCRAVEEVMEANKQVVEGIDSVSEVTKQVTSGASETLENCNRNLQSVGKVSQIIERLGEGAAELQKSESIG